MACETDLREAFTLLHPLCSELPINPNVELLTKIRKTILKINPVTVDELQEFLLIPFTILFKKLKSRAENFVIEFFRCLNALLTQSDAILENGIFYELINGVILNISPPLPNEEDGRRQLEEREICEEVKLEGVRVLDLLFAKASYEVLHKFYWSNSSLPFLGHAVTVLLDFVEKEKLRSLRTVSIRAILRLSFCCVEGPFCKSLGADGSRNDVISPEDFAKLGERFCSVHCKESEHFDAEASKNLETISGHVFASFLPGISMALTKVATGDPKQGQMLSAYSVAAFARILERTFSDELLTKSKGKNINLTGKTEFHKELPIKKSDEWVTGTSKKLEFLLEKIINNPAHSDAGSWKVRVELLKMAEALLSSCCRSLANCSEKLLNVLISGLVDDEPMVKKLAKEIVQSMSSKIKTGSNQKESDLVELLQDNLLNLVGDLPSWLNNPSDEKKLSGLRLFHGHLVMLGQKSSILTSYSFLMEQFQKTLFNLLEFDCTSLVLCLSHLDEFQVLQHGLTHERFEAYAFSKFGSRRIVDEVVDILNLIGRFWDLQSIVDQLLEAMISFRRFKKESAFCLVHILDGARSLENKSQGSDANLGWKKLEKIIDCIVNQVLDHSFWSTTFEPQKVPLRGKAGRMANDFNSRFVVSVGDEGRSCDVKDSSRSGQSPREMKEEATFACLLLDVISATALLAGQNFEPMVTKVLVPVLERIGSSQYNIQVRAFRTLFHVSLATSPTRRSDASKRWGNSEDIYRKLGGIENEVIVEMLMRCSDYLMSSVIPSLRAVDRHPRILVAFRVVIELGTPKSKMLSTDDYPLEGHLSSSSSSSSHPQKLAAHQHMMQMIHSSFKQIINSFDQNHVDFCLDFWKLFLQISLLISRTIQLEKALAGKSKSNSTLSQKAAVRKEATVEAGFSSVPEASTCAKRGSAMLSGRPDNAVNVAGRFDSKASESLTELVEFILDLERKREVMDLVDGEGVDDDDEGWNIYNSMKKNMVTSKNEREKDCDDDDDGDVENKVEVPYYIKILEQILDRSQHFLSSADPQVRAVVLEVIKVICPTMKPYQDSLLPLVHRFWSSFIGRFADEEHFVSIKTFEALAVVADSAGDFVMRRILKDVVPKVVNLLTSLAKKSLRAPKNHKFLASHQLQKCILNSLGGICRQAGIEGVPLCGLMKACIPYLSAVQPDYLQEACLNTFKEFIAIDSDTVWLLLTEVYCPIPVLTPPPCSNLQPIKLSGTNKRNEYTDNVTVLNGLLEHR